MCTYIFSTLVHIPEAVPTVMLIYTMMTLPIKLTIIVIIIIIIIIIITIIIINFINKLTLNYTSIFIS